MTTPASWPFSRDLPALKKALSDLDAEFASPSMEVAGDSWQGRLLALLVASREQSLTQATNLLKENNWQPDAAKAGIQAASDDYAGRRDAVVALIQDMQTLSGRLDACYLLDDKPADGGMTVRQLYDKWKDKPVFADPAAQQARKQALQPVTGRVEELLRIEALDRSGLAPLVANPPADRAQQVAVWRRLGAITTSPWPMTVQELGTELDMRQRLRPLIYGVADAARQKALLDELDSQGNQRIKQCFAPTGGRRGRVRIALVTRVSGCAEVAAGSVGSARRAAGQMGTVRRRPGFRGCSTMSGCMTSAVSWIR